MHTATYVEQVDRTLNECLSTKIKAGESVGTALDVTGKYGVRLKKLSFKYNTVEKQIRKLVVANNSINSLM